MTDLLVATTNAGKQREFSRLLSGLPGRRVTPAQIGVELDVDEPYETYAENAAAKATAFARASGLLTLADDSGLETAALDWGPGVRTGRFGGPAISDRAAYLLEQIRGSGRREARMVCVLALGIPGPAEPQIELLLQLLILFQHLALREGTVDRQLQLLIDQRLGEHVERPGPQRFDRRFDRPVTR